MRVFVAGASGVIGRRLVPKLVLRGHEVIAMTRQPAGADLLRRLGAEPVQCDVYDREALLRLMQRAKPDVVVHQLTALPQAIDPRRIERDLAATDRIRTEGTRNLVQAALAAGARRMVAQSISFAYAPRGSMVKTEEEPLWLDAPWPFRRTVEAVADLEQQVLDAAGMAGAVLRYGYFYGPGSAYAADGSLAEMVRRRQLPLPRRGRGTFSFIHIDDAAQATVAAIEGEQRGIYNVVDDEPATAEQWLPVYAQILEAPPPRRVFPWLVRVLAGRYAYDHMTRQRGANNAKARRELAWTPQHSSWRHGFAASLRPATPSSDSAEEPAASLQLAGNAG